MVLSPELAAIGFGLLSAISWGSGDFSGGFATRRTGVIGVVAISHSFGLLLLLALAILTGEAMPAASDMLIGAVAGFSGMVGLIALYRALASGKMGIAAPVSAVLTAALPVAFSMMTRALPEPIQIIGFVLAFASIVLISYAGTSRTMSGISLALLAGTGFGLFFIMLDQIQSDAIYWPLIAARVTSTVIMFATLIFSRRASLPRDRRIISIVLVSSILDVGGNVFFLMATQSGRLDIAAVVSSLYPAATLVLAWLLLKEHLTRIQLIGVVAALIAVALISL